MIEGLKPYAEYKESGIPWARELPSGWQTERAKRLFTKMQRPVRPEDEVVTCFRDGMVTLRKNRRLRGFTEATVESGYQGIRKGDLVIHGMDAFAGAIGVSDSDGKGTPVYNVCQPRPGVIARYYAHTVREMSRAQWILALAKGIRERSTDFRYEMFGNQFVPLPPPDEQAAIVRFLEHANRKIDGFIRAKRKLIGLLNEQKQAIIHRAVTRGLDPDVPLKPSGIPWLGDIPAHWEHTRLKFEASHIVDCLHATPTYRTDGVFPAIRTADIEPGRVRLEQARKISAAEFQRWTARLKPEMGDVLYSREGERFGIAANVPADTSLCISQRMMVFRIRKRQNSEYLMWQLNCQHVYLQASLYVIGSTAPHVNVDQIKNFQLALPPLNEQKAIVEHIRAECGIINTAIARTEREIALMQEYRTRLTADIVTGKLDVREAAANLPDLSTEPRVDEALEDTDILDETEPEES